MFCQAEQGERGKSPPIPTLATKSQETSQTEENKGDKKTKVTINLRAGHSQVVPLPLIAVRALYFCNGLLSSCSHIYTLFLFSHNFVELSFPFFFILLAEVWKMFYNK